MPQRLPTPTLPGIFTPAPPPPIAPAGARSRDWGDDSQTRCCAPLLSLLSPSLFSLRSPSLSCSPFSHPGFPSPPHPHPFPLCGTADGCLGSRSRHPLQPRAEQATLRANSWLVFFRIISWSWGQENRRHLVCSCILCARRISVFLEVGSWLFDNAW